MRVDKPAGMMMLDNGQDRAVKGDSEWTPFASPSRCALRKFSGDRRHPAGRRLGHCARRPLRSRRSPPGRRTDGRRGEGGRRCGDRIVQKQAWMRGNVDWTAVEPEVRLLAAGARRVRTLSRDSLSAHVAERSSQLSHAARGQDRLPHGRRHKSADRRERARRRIGMSTCRPTAAETRRPRAASPRKRTSSSRRRWISRLRVDCRSARQHRRQHVAHARRPQAVSW